MRQFPVPSYRLPVVFSPSQSDGRGLGGGQQPWESLVARRPPPAARRLVVAGCWLLVAGGPSDAGALVVPRASVVHP